jgi:predicted glycoside hydrolase/deacetylase ChbG (UPF0249 family)
VLDGQLNSLYQKSNLYNIYGNFHDQKFVTKALKKCKFNINDIMKEYSNQIEKVLKTGTKISHLDHHHHLHLYFQSLKAVIAVAKKYKIKYVRSQKIIMHHRRSISKMLYRLCHQFYTQMHLKTISGYYDLIHLTNNQFNLEKERLKQLLKRKKGIAEIIIHPKEKHDVETKFITDNEIIHLLKPQQLINYNDLI